MKCPQCKGEFPLTWKRYIKAPFGRMICPLCHTKIVIKHRWFYWPLMLFGCFVIGIPLALLGGWKYDLAGTLIGWFIGCIAFGIPFDKFLESKFSVLKVREEKN